jgi:rhamnosyl/mannosyltransferase
LKVLQLSKFFAPVFGGIESVAWELAEGLNRAGVQADVLCANQAMHTTSERHQPLNYRVVRAASWGTLLSTSMAPALVRELGRMADGYDVLHVHMPDPMAALAIAVVRPRARVVVHWHSDVVRQRWALKLYEPLQRWLLQRADAIVATSAPYADASGPLQPFRAKVTVIPIGISDNHSRGCSQQAAALRKRFRDRKIIFSLGRMTYYKGFDVLIEAAAALPDDCVVVIGGDGPLRDDYRSAVARRGLAGKVQLPGHINDDELPSYFEACDVFCMPSTVRAEAYGVAMVEAMVMGKPIVASDIEGSGVPWVNVDGQTGFNVPVGQPEPLADALLRLLKDVGLRRRLGTASRERYCTEFNADLMTHRTMDLYSRLLQPQA